MSQASQPSREDVLDAFSVEPHPDHETLERYLCAYPKYAAELVDLSREMSRDLVQNESPLSTKDKATIVAAWCRHAGLESNSMVDPFAMLSVADLRELARRLDVPRQVVAAFRECRVILATVPRGFLALLADSVNSSIDKLEDYLSNPQQIPARAQSYKSDLKPVVGEPVSFEKLLIDAGVPEMKRAELMTDKD